MTTISSLHLVVEDPEDSAVLVVAGDRAVDEGLRAHHTCEEENRKWSTTVVEKSITSLIRRPLQRRDQEAESAEENVRQPDRQAECGRQDPECAHQERLERLEARSSTQTWAIKWKAVLQDLHFIVKEKAASTIYKRDGDDIRHTVDIDLKEALTGWKRTVQTIDGKQVNVSSAGPTQPTFEERFPQLGMPKSKTPSQRGDFLVGVKIKYPTSLTADQKKKIKEIL